MRKRAERNSIKTGFALATADARRHLGETFEMRASATAGESTYAGIGPAVAAVGMMLLFY